MTETTRADNGVNVTALLGARAALQEAPEAARFTWRATNKWISGTHSESTVQGFFGLGEEQETERSFVTHGDHPPQFAAENNGPTPVETLLTALGGCLTAGVAAVAQQRGIQLNAVTAHVEGDHDIRGILGADPEVRNGFNDIRVRYEIDADASPEEIEAIVAQSQKRSAVFDALTNPTAVTVTVQ